jgi:hypothetical protein
MKRQLPRVMVGKHEYEVDMRAGELRSVKDASKTLEFFKMDQEKQNLAFWFDNIHQKLLFELLHGAENVDRISFPVRALDPEFFNELKAETKEAEDLFRAGKSIYQQEGGIHAGVPIEGNKARMLPMINLYGTDFFLDLRLKQLREADNPGNAISWKHMDEDNFHMSVWYNTTTKNAFSGSMAEARQRDDVKHLHLPPLDKTIREGIKRHEEKVNGTKALVESEIPKRRQKGRGL